MFKNLLIFICVYLPFVSFGQSRQLVDSINKVIGPGYVLDVDTALEYHSYNSFNEVDLSGDGVKEIIIAAAKIDTVENTDTNRIFVLERKDNQLHVLESSADYDVDGRGPSIGVHGRSLTVTHSFHHGMNDITFQFNRQVKKYVLVTIGAAGVSPNTPEQGQYTSFVNEYDVKKQIFTKATTIGSYEDESKEKTKTTKSTKKLPETISLNLGDLKDPSEYDVFSE
jgi:hypothetical protein